MKIKYLATILLIGMFILSGCSEKNTDDYKSDFSE